MCKNEASDRRLDKLLFQTSPVGVICKLCYKRLTLLEEKMKTVWPYCRALMAESQNVVQGCDTWRNLVIRSCWRRGRATQVKDV